MIYIKAPDTSWEQFEIIKCMKEYALFKLNTLEKFQTYLVEGGTLDDKKLKLLQHLLKDDGVYFVEDAH